MYPQQNPWMFFSYFQPTKKCIIYLYHIQRRNSLHHWGKGPKDHHLQLIEDFESQGSNQTNQAGEPQHSDEPGLDQKKGGVFFLLQKIKIT